MKEENKVKEKKKVMDITSIVNYIVGEYMVPIYLLDDIISRMYLCIYNCINLYKKDRKTKFMTYLIKSLKNEINTVLREEERNKKIKIKIKEKRMYVNEVCEETPFDTYSQKELKKWLAKAIRSLPLKERDIIRRRFGVGKFKEHTIKKIAEAHALSEDQVKRIIKKHLKAIKETHGNILKDFL